MTCRTPKKKKTTWLRFSAVGGPASARTFALFAKDKALAVTLQRAPAKPRNDELNASEVTDVTMPVGGGSLTRRVLRYRGPLSN